MKKHLLLWLLCLLPVALSALALAKIYGASWVTVLTERPNGLSKVQIEE